MIDHNERALSFLNFVKYPHDDAEGAHLYLAEAQVHATLALAEQQRTANLIAVATAQWANGDSMFAGEIETAQRIILERLGLGDA